MYCANCGKEIKEEDLFCPECGAPAGNAPKDCGPGQNACSRAEEDLGHSMDGEGDPVGPENKENRPKNKRKGFIIGLIIAAAVIIIAAAVVIAVVLAGKLRSSAEGGSIYEAADDGAASSYEDVLDSCISAIENADLDALLDLIPEEVSSALLEENGISSDEFYETLEEFEETISSAIVLIDMLFDDWTLSYSVVYEEYLTGDDLKEVQKEYAQYDVAVTDAVCVEISFEIGIEGYDLSEVDSLTDGLGTIELYFVESDGQWYLDICSLDL